MNTYIVRCWYRFHSCDEKDFYDVEVEAENEESAKSKAKLLSRRIFNTSIVKP